MIAEPTEPFDVTKVKFTKTPIFRFVCPKCGTIVREGPVDFDMEDMMECEKCDFADEAWMFPHTILGSEKWTIGGHYNNDPLTSLDFDEVIREFTWPLHRSIMVHGRKPYVFGTLTACVKALEKEGLLK